MFTVPDGDDAAATCPPFKPVGPTPAGWWQDCDPNANFAGTIPLADYFNELCANLRGLLYQTQIVDAGPGVVAVKGASTTLAQAVLRAPVITQGGFFIYVDPRTGAAEPVDPIVNGDAFDTLSSALKWLARYRIAPNATVLIDLAPTTIQEAAPVVVNHPDGHRLYIRGDDKNNTVLSFPSIPNGLLVSGPLGGLYNLTLTGSNQPNQIGLAVDGGHIDHLDAMVVQNWGAVGVQVMNAGFIGLSAAEAYYETGTLHVYDSGQLGIVVMGGSRIEGVGQSIIDVERAGLGFPPPFGGGILVSGGSSFVCNACQILHTCLGLRVTTKSHFGAAHLGVGDSLDTQAVLADTNSEIVNTQFGGNPGDWWTWNLTANTPQNFVASVFSLISPGHALAPYNLANSSPPPNVLGNTQSMIPTS